MPVDLEMLLSSSNHAFLHYSSDDCSSYCDNVYDRTLFRRNHCVPSPLVKLQNSFFKKSEHDAFTEPNRYKADHKVTTSQEFYGTRKKKVSFADDKGLKLVEVREIPAPPKWADDVITLLIGSRKRSVVKEKKWKLAFDHPPWSDEKLEEALETNMVSLESISIKEGTDDYLIGVVKVKNLNFEKNVFLRVTFDRWLSYDDIPCTYEEPNNSIVLTKANKYDTFHFNFKISPVASRYEVVEFSVGFNCNGQEYWDNNGGINYRLITEYPKSCSPDLNQNAYP